MTISDVKESFIVLGCLMLIAWMMCASTALILAKYYKAMWPNDSLCGERVWFAVSLVTLLNRNIIQLS